MQFNFFATKDDLLPGVLAFEAEHQVRYIVWGFTDAPHFEQYSSVTELPDLGRSIHGHRCERTYVVMPADADVKTKAVPQRRGGTKYELDLTNVCRFAFSPGGVYEDRFLIDGDAGVNMGDEDSIALYKKFMRKVWIGWTSIQSYYVGPQALQLLKNGYRLTMSTQTPESLDLRLP